MLPDDITQNFHMCEDVNEHLHFNTQKVFAYEHTWLLILDWTWKMPECKQVHTNIKQKKKLIAFEHANRYHYGMVCINFMHINMYAHANMWQYFTVAWISTHAYTLTYYTTWKMHVCKWVYTCGHVTIVRSCMHANNHVNTKMWLIQEISSAWTGTHVTICDYAWKLHLCKHMYLHQSPMLLGNCVHVILTYGHNLKLPAYKYVHTH